MIGYVVGAVVLVIIIGVVWGVLHLRRSQKVAYAAIAKVKLPEIDTLRQECERIFFEKFSERLDLNDIEKSAKLLSARLDNVESLKGAFAKEDFYWYFVLPVGAFLGELLRVHAGAEWKEGDDGAGPMMTMPVLGESATTYPFHKVMKQVTVGDKGDIYAYLKIAPGLEKAIAKTPET